MVTEDGEVSAIHKVTELAECQHNGHALQHWNAQLALWFGKHLAHVLDDVWLALWITLQQHSTHSHCACISVHLV